ncbi:hypothetical protein [Microcoleus sp.]|uniref:hypothetical protein n=1 Tax=Microcoleus sp. TaxID=44472 RepID=UPI003593478A
MPEICKHRPIICGKSGQGNAVSLRKIIDFHARNMQPSSNYLWQFLDTAMPFPYRKIIDFHARNMQPSSNYLWQFWTRQCRFPTVKSSIFMPEICNHRPIICGNSGHGSAVSLP